MITVDQSTLDATRIVLLFNPEFLTAAGYRKRRILSHIAEHGIESSSSKSLFDQEIVLLDTILTSDLPRQTKSPTLWYHRYWLLSTFKSLLLPWSRASSDKESDLLLRELRIVFKSGERHPKNFYAWHYLRGLIGLLRRVIRDSGSDDHQIGLCTVAERVQDWCLRHVSDISGWAFLSFVLDEAELSTERRFSLLAELLRMTINLRLENESIWQFMRTAMASQAISDQDRSTLLHQLKISIDHDVSEALKLQKNNTVYWISKRLRVKGTCV